MTDIEFCPLCGGNLFRYFMQKSSACLGCGTDIFYTDNTMTVIKNVAINGKIYTGEQFKKLLKMKAFI
jgi:uncharacterized protein (DUF983 family)